MLTHIVLHEVAVLEARRVTLRRQAIEDVLGDVDTAVHAARAADCDDELALALFDVLRHEEIDHLIEQARKLLCHRPFRDVLRDLRHSAALVAHRFDVEGVRQEAHVEHHVRIERHAELEAERQHVDAHLLAARRAEQPVDLVAQVDLAQFRRVDDVRRLRAHGCQALALLRDAFGDARGRRHRMAAARLLVAADDGRVGCIHKEHLIGHIVLFHVVERMDKRVKELAAARVDDEHDLADMAAGMLAELDKLRDEYRRQVVHAEVAEILEVAARLRLAAARHARHDDETESLFLCLFRFYHFTHLSHLRVPDHRWPWRSRILRSGPSHSRRPP